MLVLAFNGAMKVERDSRRKYFLLRVNISNCDQMKKYDEIRKTATRHGDDYTTRCLLDYQYFKDHHQLIAVDLSKQKELNTDQ